MASIRKRGKKYEYRIIYRDRFGIRHEKTGLPAFFIPV